MLTGVQMSVVTVISQAFLYGIYLATLVQCFPWFMFTDEGWKLRERIKSLPMAFATIFIFLMSTTNLMTTLQCTLEFLRRGKERHMYGSKMAKNISEPLAIILIDGVMIYRCWIVYSKLWRVICIPVTFWLASLACSGLVWHYRFKEKLEYHLQDVQIRERALTGLYVCNIATTVYTTTAIIYRLWRTRKNSGSSPKRLNCIIRVLAETGILYTSMTVFTLIGSVLNTGNNPTWVEILIYKLSDAIGLSMAGITFNLILIRLYHCRVELQDSLADSRNIDGVQTLSRLQFINPRITVPSEGPLSNVRGQAIDEIQDSCRSSDRTA